MAQPIPRLIGGQQLLEQLRPFMQRKILQLSCQVSAVAGPARHGLMLAVRQACYTAMQQVFQYLQVPADSLSGVHVDYAPSPRPTAREDRLDTLHMHVLLQPQAADMASRFLLSEYVGGLALAIPGMQHPVLAQLQLGERQVYLARVQLEGLPLLPPGPTLSLLQDFTAELGGMTVHWVGQWDPSGAIVNRCGPAGPIPSPIFLPFGLLPPNLSSTTPVALLEGGTSRLARGPDAWSASLEFPDVAQLRVALRRVPNRARHSPQALLAWAELAAPVVAGPARPASPAAPGPPPAGLDPVAGEDPPPGLEDVPLPPQRASPPPPHEVLAPRPEEPAPPLPRDPPPPPPSPAPLVILPSPLPPLQAPLQPQPPAAPLAHPHPVAQQQPLRPSPRPQQPQQAPAEPIGVVKPRRSDRPAKKPVVDNTGRTPPKVGSWVCLQKGSGTFYGLIIAHNQDVRRGTNIRITLPRVVWDSGEYTDDGRWDDPLRDLQVVVPAAVPDTSVVAVVAYLNGTGCGDDIGEPLFDIVAFNISHRRVEDQTPRLSAAPDSARTPAGLRRAWLASRRPASAASSDYGGGAGSAEDDLNERALYGSKEDPFVAPRKGRSRFTAPALRSLSTAQNRTGRQQR